MRKTLRLAFIAGVWCVLLAPPSCGQSPIISAGLNVLENMIRTLRRQYNMHEEGHNRDVPGDEILRQGEYDFIVVGAGAAGSVVANRLSANPDWKVLLIEVGKDENAMVDIPIATFFLQKSDFSINYLSEPQDDACLAMKNHQCVWIRGRSLGGSTSINAMLYTRGDPLDYDEWAGLGNEGWSYKDVLPFFLKSENIQIPELMDSPYHGKGGYLNIQRVPTQTVIGNSFLDAGRELGYPYTESNARDIRGFSRFQEAMRNGSRLSASKAFLRPIRGRKNLHITMRSRVTRVIIDPLTKRAIGVEFTKKKLLYKVKARREVILSAGSLNSPQILMLSGVGPRDHLQELGIPVIQDLKVGHNLQDQVGFSGLTYVVKKGAGIVIDNLPIVQAVTEYVLHGKGLLTNPGGETLAFFQTKYAEDERPDLEILLFPSNPNADSGGTIYREVFGMTPEFHEAYFKAIDGKDTFSLVPIVIRPKSRGLMKLRDKSPWHWPKFYANYFSDPHDMLVLIEGIKIALQLGNTTAFRKLDAKLHDAIVPGCEPFRYMSDEYWECASRYLTSVLHHQVGTCKMGPATDPDAVVDPQLRVHGIEGLRVVDASIMPREVTAHTMAPSYMVGEKGADMVLNHWTQKGDYYGNFLNKY